MTLSIDSRPQHAALAVDACIDHQEVVIPGETMLVDQMATSLFPIAAHFVAAFDEAGESFTTTFSLSGNDGIVVLGDVKFEEVSGWEIGFAFSTAITVHLCVMTFIFGIR